MSLAWLPTCIIVPMCRVMLCSTDTVPVKSRSSQQGVRHSVSVDYTWGISLEGSASAFDGFGVCAILAIATVIRLKRILQLCLSSALRELLNQSGQYSPFAHQILAITECMCGCIDV